MKSIKEKIQIESFFNQKSPQTGGRTCSCGLQHSWQPIYSDDPS